MRWENAVARIKNIECTLSDRVLAFKLLNRSHDQLTDMEHKLVISGVDYKVGAEKKTLEEQTKASLKKILANFR